jgi:hypothetical protein
MIEHEPLGEDDVADLLLLNYKGADFVGHRYGPDSNELRLTLGEMDRNLARIIGALEAKVGELRANDAVGGRTVAIALVVLQLHAVTNHAAAAIRGHSILNALLSAINCGCVGFGTLALCLRTVDRDIASRAA